MAGLLDREGRFGARGKNSKSAVMLHQPFTSGLFPFPFAPANTLLFTAAHTELFLCSSKERKQAFLLLLCRKCPLKRRMGEEEGSLDVL